MAVVDNSAASPYRQRTPIVARAKLTIAPRAPDAAATTTLQRFDSGPGPTRPQTHTPSFAETLAALKLVHTETLKYLAPLTRIATGQGARPVVVVITDASSDGASQQLMHEDDALGDDDGDGAADDGGGFAGLDDVGDGSPQQFRDAASRRRRRSP